VSRPVAERLVRHSDTRIVVLEELRIAFLPIPKSGCTSLLWSLAHLAGLDPAGFARSDQAEVSRSMAVHDMTRWRPQHRWQERSPAERRRILQDDSWLRLTVVRDPAARLWSAWQSKLLLQEPRFVARFGDQPWFPHGVDTVPDLLASFRAFVRALDVDPERAPHDAHWGSQAGLMAAFAPTWTGRSEAASATLDRLREHLAGQGADPALVRDDVPRENANPIPYHPSVYDETAAAAVARIHADDYARWDYAPPVAAAPDEPWEQAAGLRLASVRALADRHRRIGELLDLAEERRQAVLRARGRAHRAEQELADLRASRSWRVTAPLRRIRER